MYSCISENTYRALSVDTLAGNRFVGHSQGCTATRRGVSYVGLVQSFDQLVAAYRLVYREYRRCGYIPENPEQIHFTNFQLYPVSQTLVALDDDQSVIGTGSIVISSRLGLPSSKIFQAECAGLERQNRKIAEATLLSCVSQPDIEAHEISVQLIRAGFSYLIARRVSQLCVVVNPKHVRFWEQTLGFTVLSGTKSCPQVQDAPGVLLAFDIDALVRGEVSLTPLFQKEILDRWIAPEHFPYDMTLEGDELAELIALRKGLQYLS